MLTKERLDAIIRRRYAEGTTLSIDHIDGEQYSRWYIKDKAEEHYDGWTNALVANKVPPNVRKNLTKQDVINELNRLQREEYSMKIGDFDNWLKHGIKKYFGGYKNAKKELGIEVRKDKRIEKLKYTDDIAKKVLRECYDDGKTLSEVYEEHKGIIQSISKRYGGVKQAFQELGIPEIPKKQRKPTPFKWTDDVIQNSLKEVFEKESNLASNYLKDSGYGSLVHAVKKRYGSWNKGLKALGYSISYETPQFDWTKERVKQETIRALEEGEAPTLPSLKKRIRGYGRAVYKYFGSFDKVKEYCGICAIKDAPKPKESNTKYYRPDLQTKRGLKREIIRLYYVGCPLNYNAIRRKKSHLLVAAKQLFGDWRSAVEYSGIKYDEISVTDNVRSECGEEFEKVLGEILIELGVTFEKYAHEKLDPDFVLPNGKWVDAKLSEWTDANETVRRYLPECSELIIVYLQGRKEERYRGRKYRYKTVSAYVLTEKLSRDTRDYYNNKLKEIENKADANEIGSHSA